MVSEGTWDVMFDGMWILKSLNRLSGSPVSLVKVTAETATIKPVLRK